MDSSFTDDMIEILMPLQPDVPDETPQDLLDQPLPPSPILGELISTVMTDSLDSPSPPLPTGVALGLLCGHSSQVSEVALVSDQHDDDLDANLMDRQTDHQQKGGKTTHTTCPIPGCGRVVKRLWNHLNQYHKKMGDEIGTPQCPKRRR